ncbi:unnamed protein product, partial [Symbiodinium sp. CCMP2456]
PRCTMRVVAVAALAARIASAGDRFLQAAAQVEELRFFGFEAPVTFLAGSLRRAFFLWRPAIFQPPQPAPHIRSAWSAV